MLVAFGFVQGVVFWLPVEWPQHLYHNDDQGFPNDAHGNDNDVSDKIHFLIDRPPLVEPQMGKRYETVASNEECIQFANDENCCSNFERRSNLLELWVVLKNRHNLLKKVLVYSSIRSPTK